MKTDKIPEAAQAVIDARKEEKGLKRFKEMEREENEAPKKAVKGMYDKVRGMFGLDEKKPPVKKAKGGKVGSASKRADGCAMRGKTRGKMV